MTSISLRSGYTIVLFGLMVLGVLGVLRPIQAQDTAARSDLLLLRSNDPPLGPASGDKVGWGVVWFQENELSPSLQVTVYLSPGKTVSPVRRPSMGNVFVGIFSEGSPDTSVHATELEEQFQYAGSFTPPSEEPGRTSALLTLSVPLPETLDRDGNNHLEIQLVIKPYRRGLTESCDAQDICGASSSILSVPLPAPRR